MTARPTAPRPKTAQDEPFSTPAVLMAAPRPSDGERNRERERERGKVRSFLRVGIVYLVVVVIFV